jgi:hypothetical protein
MLSQIFVDVRGKGPQVLQVLSRREDAAVGTSVDPLWASCSRLLAAVPALQLTAEPRQRDVGPDGPPYGRVIARTA